MISEILGLFVNKFTEDDKYSLCNSETLQQPFEVQLSHKQKNLSEIFDPFLKYTWNIEHCEKKMILIAYVFPKLQTAKSVVK